MPVSISATHPLCILVSLTILFRYTHVLLAWNSVTQHMQHVVGSRQHSLLLTGLVSLGCVVVTCIIPVLDALCCFSGSQSTSNDTCLALMYVETWCLILSCCVSLFGSLSHGQTWFCLRVVAASQTNTVICGATHRCWACCVKVVQPICSMQQQYWDDVAISSWDCSPEA